MFIVIFIYTVYIYICSIQKQTDLRVHRTTSFSPSTLKTKSGSTNWSQEISDSGVFFRDIQNPNPNRNTSNVTSYRSANLQTWDWMTQRSFMFLNKKSIPPSCHWKDLLKLSMASLSGRGSMSGQCWAFRTSTWSFDWLGRSASPIKWSSNGRVSGRFSTSHTLQCKEIETTILNVWKHHGDHKTKSKMTNKALTCLIGLNYMKYWANK